jgi:hypothetical protein
MISALGLPKLEGNDFTGYRPGTGVLSAEVLESTWERVCDWGGARDTCDVP